MIDGEIEAALRAGDNYDSQQRIAELEAKVERLKWLVRENRYHFGNFPYDEFMAELEEGDNDNDLGNRS